MLKTKNGTPISPIGIGTWTINKDNINNEIEALNYYHSQGINFIDVVLAYDNGATLDVIADFVKNTNREDLFINAFITFGCNTPNDIENQIDIYLDKLGTKYLDCITLHSLDCIGFDLDTYANTINNLKSTGKFLNIGYSNLSPDDLNNLKSNMQYFEGLYNIENKLNEDTGILSSCQDSNIPFYAYQPLRRNRTAKQNYPEIVLLANKYNKTQNQILINWLIKHKHIGILIKSSNINHIKENLESLDFEMTLEEYNTLNDFRNKEFDNLPVCYKNEPGKIRIDQIPNQPIGIL